MRTSKDKRPPKKLRGLASQKPSFGIEMVEVHVGEADKAKAFHVHHELLTQHSDFFKAALNGDWKERADHAITLPEVDPEEFEHFYWFIYTGRLFLSSPNDSFSDEDGDEYDDEFEKISDAWILGNVLQSATLKDAVSDYLVIKIEAEKAYPIALHEAIDEHAARSSPFRTLLVDIAVRQWDEKEFESMDADDTSKKFVLDVLLALVKFKRQGVREMMPWVNAGCRYHEHGDRKPCYKKLFRY